MGSLCGLLWFQSAFWWRRRRSRGFAGHGRPGSCMWVRQWIVHQCLHPAACWKLPGFLTFVIIRTLWSDERSPCSKSERHNLSLTQGLGWVWTFHLFFLCETLRAEEPETSQQLLHAIFYNLCFESSSYDSISRKTTEVTTSWICSINPPWCQQKRHTCDAEDCFSLEKFWFVSQGIQRRLQLALPPLKRTET